MKIFASIKHRFEKTAAILISLLMILSMSFISAPLAFADDGNSLHTTETPGASESLQPTDTPVSTESSQPSETAKPDETPQPAETPQTTESPQATGTPQASESPQPSDSPQATDTDSSSDTSVQYAATMPDEQKIIEVGGKTCVDGEVIVKFKNSVTASSIDKVLDSKDSEQVKDIPGKDAVLTTVPNGETVQGFIDEMKDMPNVEYVQPNYIYKADKTVNDPYTNPQNQFYQWYLNTIDVYDAWNVTMGSPDIKVADLDTGIDLSNTELNGKICAQWDYVNNDGEAKDDNGHGTFTAGIIAAEADNGVGIAGIAPKVKVMVLKVLNAEGNGTSADVCNAIHYAVDNGAKVINMSFGGNGKDTYEEEAVNYAVSKGVVCVAAAGNDNTDSYVSPSDDEACISVTATDENNKKASYSNYGPNKDIAAPGNDIISTVIGGGYGRGNGTSFAAPMVSATAALMLSVTPGLSVDQIKNILYSTATDLRDSNYYGHGLLNASKAVQMSAAVSLSAVSAGYNSVQLTWTSIPGATGYEVWRSLSSGDTYSYVCSVGDHTYINNGLTTGAVYYYKVRPVFTDGSETAYGNFSNYAYAKPLPSIPSLEVKSLSYSSVKVSWNAVSGATGYKVYRGTSLNGSYSLIKTTKGLSFTNTGLKTGRTYYYKVCSYTGKILSGFTSGVQASPVLFAIPWANAFSHSPTSVSLSWGSVSGKSGYEISRSLQSGGVYTVIKNTKSKSYKNTGLIPNRTYYYRVRAYRIVSGKKVYGGYTTELNSTPFLGTVSGAGVAARSSTVNKIYWNKVAGSSGYEVVKCDPAGDSVQHILYTKLKYAYNKRLKPGQEYYYKVRAFVGLSRKKIFSDYSPVVGIGTK